MTPTRTPDGDSLYCALCDCGFTLAVSPPAGDATCPFCGAIAWRDDNATRDQNGLERVSTTIRQHVADITALCRDPRHERADVLLGCINSMVSAMAARGGAAWEVDGNGCVRLIAASGKLVRQPVMRWC